ncbi:MAG: DUF5721 family protein [Defluviitaleaceae bacterium]|nr:DUF5721 family protein [Defluviitaleaceae bacterium]
MTIFNILEQDTNDILAKLFKEDLFNEFEIRSLNIESFANFAITGRITWAEAKPHALLILKGRPMPTIIKIIFSPTEEVMQEIHPNAASLHLTLNFTGEKIIFTTATSQKEFALDKTLDETWDEWVAEYFKNNGVAVLEE